MENTIDQELVIIVAKRRVNTLQEENIYLTALVEQLSNEINRLNDQLSEEVKVENTN